MPTLRQLREERCISQADLSKMSGVAESTICRLEQRDQKPRFVTIRKLAKALQVEPYEIRF